MVFLLSAHVHCQDEKFMLSKWQSKSSKKKMKKKSGKRRCCRLQTFAQKNAQVLRIFAIFLALRFLRMPPPPKKIAIKCQVFGGDLRILRMSWKSQTLCAFFAHFGSAHFFISTTSGHPGLGGREKEEKKRKLFIMRNV